MQCGPAAWRMHEKTGDKNPLGSLEKKKRFYFYSSVWRIARGTVGSSQINGDNMLALTFSSAQRCFEFKTNQQLKKGLQKGEEKCLFSSSTHAGGKKEDSQCCRQ